LNLRACELAFIQGLQFPALCRIAGECRRFPGVVRFFRRSRIARLAALTNQRECTVSKNPSPRLDQLRAMREAQFASAARSRAADKPAAPAKSAPAPESEMPETAKTSKAKTTAGKKPAKAKKAKAKKTGR
jgi:hypothetical protein